MMLNNSDSKLTKVVTIIFAISAVIGLACQIMNILALTRTKLGKLLRKNLISTMYDCMDESIDQAAIRMPGMIKKMESISDSIYQ